MPDDGSPDVLYVTDHGEDVDAVVERVEAELDATVAVEHDSRAALPRLEDADVDCVVAEHAPDGHNGLECLETLRNRTDSAAVPVVLFSADGSGELARRAFDAGVTDYVIDDGGAESRVLLAERIRRAIGVAETETELAAAADARFLGLARSLNAGIVSIDEDSVVQFANPAVEDILGYAPEELIGESLAVVIPDRLQEPHLRRVRAYLETGERHLDWSGVEFPARHEDGHEVPVSIAFGEFDHDDEHFFTGAIIDLTDQVAHEQELERQNERLEEFVSLVSHDLRSPLNVAQGNLDLAREECDSEPLDTVAGAHDRMAELIDDLLALARHGESVENPESVSLETVARDAWGTVDATDATFELAGDVRFRADRSKLVALLENLFRNAVEHGSTSNRSAPSDAVEHGGSDVRSTVGPLANGDGFYVADDGPGIPESERDRVVESGYSTSDRGTGFGLTVVGEVAEAHGWSIAITESDAGGARFEIDGVDVVADESD